jgi:hypothetical protein
MFSSKSFPDSARFKNLLRDEGIYEALNFLNSKSAHRFTALYSLEGATLKNICLVDKENASIRQMDSVKVSDSYCLYVRDSGQKFITPDSLHDDRVQGHPKQATIQSYCGMPLVGDQAMLGTLCHFDFVPLAYTDEEVTLLESVSPILVSWLEEFRQTPLRNNSNPSNSPANATYFSFVDERKASRNGIAAPSRRSTRPNTNQRQRMNSPQDNKTCLRRLKTPFDPNLRRQVLLSCGEFIR